MLLNFESELKSLKPRPNGPEAEAEVTKPRPRLRPKFWPPGQFGLDALTSLSSGSKKWAFDLGVLSGAGVYL